MDRCFACMHMLMCVFCFPVVPNRVWDGVGRADLTKKGKSMSLRLDSVCSVPVCHMWFSSGAGRRPGWKSKGLVLIVFDVLLSCPHTSSCVHHPYSPLAKVGFGDLLACFADSDGDGADSDDHPELQVCWFSFVAFMFATNAHFFGGGLLMYTSLAGLV